MKIAVLVKQVPDMDRVKFDREKGVIDRNSAGVTLNPFDLNALEAALVIKEQTGASVVAVSMGPPRAEEALQEAIARGADEAYLLTDRAFGGADVKATSKTLAAAIKKTGDVDLILAGLQSVDGDTGQVGAEVAQYLGMPGVCSVLKVLGCNDKSVQVVVDMWDEQYVKDCAYPVLLTVTKEANVPRLPSFKDKMRARKAEITQWHLADLEAFVSAEELGIKGSPTVVRKIEIPPHHERKGKVYRDALEDALLEFRTVLRNSKVLESEASV